VRVEIGAAWDRLNGGAIDINITSAFEALRAMSRNSYREDIGFGGIQMFEGSVLWDTRSQSVTFSDGRSLGRAGLVGRVFLDANGNGRRDPDEAPAADIRVRVGAQYELTDSTGAFEAWDLLPYEEQVVAVDSMSIDNPLWVPATPAFRVLPGPNAFERVDIPLVMAGGVSGQVVIGAGERSAAGVPVIIEHEETRAVVHTVTFSDGEFYVFGLRPGTYTLTIQPEYLDRIQGTAESVTLRVDPAAASVIVEDIVLGISVP
jgi:hypothetical protein